MHRQFALLMTHFIDSVARLTRSRDRDALEATIAGVIADVVRPTAIRLFKFVPIGDRIAVHCRVIADAGGDVHLADLPARAGMLPSIDAFPWVRPWLDAPVDAVVETVVVDPHRYVARITDGEEPFGWIEIDHHLPFSDEHQRLIRGLLCIYANHLAILDYGERDSLTGLKNRKTFDDTFLRVLADSHRMVPDDGEAPPAQGVDESAPPDGFWLGVVDIDHFKRINDQFGHLYGDEVLVLMARLMRESFRLADRLYRFGGEEFAVLLDRTAVAHAQEVFERFRRTVERHEFPQIGQVTVSIGFTRIQAGDTPTHAFERADNALYHAKEHGRNQVCSYDTLAREGQFAQKTVGAAAEFF
jgi:diguanylate cyclase (GGDEF)-like protein